RKGRCCAISQLVELALRAARAEARGRRQCVLMQLLDDLPLTLTLEKRLARGHHPSLGVDQAALGASLRRLEAGEGLGHAAELPGEPRRTRVAEAAQHLLEIVDFMQGGGERGFGALLFDLTERQERGVGCRHADSPASAASRLAVASNVEASSTVCRR